MPSPIASEFELPEGWIPTKLGDLISPSKEKVDPSQCPNASYLGLEHVESHTGRIFGHGRACEAKSTKTLFRAGDVIYGKLRPYLNKVCIPDFDGVCSTDFLVFPAREELESRILMRFLLRPEVVEFASRHSTGVQLPRVNFGVLAELEFPLPPLAEQKRIVASVEQLLAHVNSAQEHLGCVPTLLKGFRHSVLAAACSGYLTADWREANLSDSAEEALARSATRVDRRAVRHLVRRGSVGVPEPERPEMPAGWAARSVRQLVEAGAILDFQDGNHGSLYPRVSDFGDTGVKFLTATQVFDNSVLLDEAPLLKQEKAKLLRIGHALPGDVLLTHNATVGRVAVLPEYDGDVILGTSVTYYRTNRSVVLPEYLCYFMQGQFWQRQLQSVMEQTTRNQVSVTKQVEFTVLVPPTAEQREIVRRVGVFFRLANAIEERVAAATTRADKLTQAILAKAFRGQLVLPEAELARREGRSYEPASALLSRIHKASSPTASDTRRSRRPRRLR